MRVAISGSTGLIGTALTRQLAADGHTVQPLVRDRAKAIGDAVYFSPSEGVIDGDALEGVDAVVHLAGAPIADGRWTDKVKARIKDSRVDGTRLLATALADLDDKPSVLVSGSAVGYYGGRGDELLTEESSPGTGFLPDVVTAWEAATRPAEEAGIRVAHLRTGVVLDGDDGALAKMLLPFKLGVGGKIGSGQQWFPWISLQDEIAAIRFLIERDDLSGPFNLTAPTPVTNAEYTKALGKVLGRPTILPIPGIAMKIAFGEMGEALMLDSQRIVPSRLHAAGFTFEHPDVVSGLRAALA